MKNEFKNGSEAAGDNRRGDEQKRHNVSTHANTVSFDPFIDRNAIITGQSIMNMFTFHIGDRFGKERLAMTPVNTSLNILQMF
jgi:hypothetical protein